MTKILQKYKLIIPIVFSVCFFSPNYSFAQKDEDKEKVEFLYSFPKYLKWQNGTENFTIGVLGGSKYFMKAFKKYEKKRYPYGKSFTAVYILSPDVIDQFEINMLYVGPEYNDKLPLISKQAVIRDLLLITDNWDDKKSVMINFIEKDNKFTFEANTRNLADNGIIANTKSITSIGAINIDDRYLYEQSEKNLKEEKEKVRAQREELKMQELKLKYQTKKIVLQREKIAENQKEIEQKQKEIAIQKKELGDILVQAEQSKKELAEKIEILKQKELAIEIQNQKLTEQQLKVDEQTKILQKQSDEIDERQSKIRNQKLEIAAQTGIIQTQKNALTIFSVLLATILVLTFLIFRSLKTQKKQNKLLADQKEEIQKQAEQLEVVNKTLAKLSIVASETSNAVAILDTNGNFEWLNAGFTRMYGYTLQLLQNERGSTLAKLNSHPKIETIISECIKNKKSVGFESLIITRKGEEKWLQTTLSPTIGINSEVDKLVMIESDITEAKNAEKEIAKQNKQITGSILYAKRIQEAVLSPKEIIDSFLPEHFILFKPRDIVSGDFYWAAEKNDKLIITAADCTGHGVPGAFMSMLGIAFLNQIIAENREDTLQANSILEELRIKVKTSLRQTGKEGEAKDGMDMALCIIDKQNMKMEYAGAQNPLIIVRNNELIEIRGDIMPIGISYDEKPFRNNVIDIQRKDTFYIYSDGYADQFGGNPKKKFFTKRLKQLFQKINDKPLYEQEKILDSVFEDFRGEINQIDDVLVIGLKV